jgi:hypothetical protein
VKLNAWFAVAANSLQLGLTGLLIAHGLKKVLDMHIKDMYLMIS